MDTHNPWTARKLCEEADGDPKGGLLAVVYILVAASLTFGSIFGLAAWAVLK